MQINKVVAYNGNRVGYIIIRCHTENWRRITGGVVAALVGRRCGRAPSLVFDTRELKLRGSVCDLFVIPPIPFLFTTINFWPDAAKNNNTELP